MTLMQIFSEFFRVLYIIDGIRLASRHPPSGCLCPFGPRAHAGAYACACVRVRACVCVCVRVRARGGTDGVTLARPAALAGALGRRKGPGASVGRRRGGV